MARDEVGDVNTTTGFLVGHHRQFIFIVNKVELCRRVLSRGVSYLIECLQKITGYVKNVSGTRGKIRKYKAPVKELF